MLLLDVNVLVAAHRADHPHHDPVRAWLEVTLRGDEAFGVPVAAWGSFLRLVTNRRIFEVPTPRADAFEFVEAMRAQRCTCPSTLDHAISTSCTGCATRGTRSETSSPTR